LVFQQQPSNAGVNAPINAVTVQVVDPGGVALTSDSGRPITIALGANPGDGTLGGTLTVNDVNGVATFSNLSLNAVGQGYTLAVSSTNLNGATSTPFNVTATPASNVHYFAVGADAGGGPQVNVYNAADGSLKFSFFAFDATFTGGVRVAVGDVNGDGVPDIVTAAGPNGGPRVRVFDGIDMHVLADFFAYDSTFTGGIYVALGDVNHDGFADIITGADAGGGPHVQVFSGRDGHAIYSFFAYDSTFTGGVRVAAGDINNDGFADMIVAAGPGGGPHVQVFSGLDRSVLRSFFAYGPNFHGGIYVSVGDINHDGQLDIITGAGAGGGPHVQVFSGIDGSVLQSYFAYDVTFSGGVRVASVDLNGDGRDDILTVAGPSGGPHVHGVDGLSLGTLDTFFALDTNFTGGLFVGAH
jgi:hypothetical protein